MPRLEFDNCWLEYHIGDCLELLKDIPDKSIDLVVTDPPYNTHCAGIEAGGIFTRENKTYLADIDNGFGSDFKPTIFLKETKRLMKIYNAYWWCSRALLYDYIKFAKENGFNYDILIWNKLNPMPTKNNKYLPDTEYCIFMRGKGPYFNNNLPYDCYRKVYHEPVQKQFEGHPTPKPLSIITKQIQISSQLGETVLDPFLGSGTTLFACRRTGRNGIGFEINPDYEPIIRKRIRANTKSIWQFTDGDS